MAENNQITPIAGIGHMFGKTLTMKAFILTASFIVSIIFFGGTYFANSYVFEQSVKNNALRNADTLAQVTFNSMFQVMSSGWTRQQLIAFLASTKKMADKAHSVEIFRGDLVVQRFGPIEQAEMDAPVRDAIYQGQPIKFAEGNLVRYVFPLKAENRCLGCHTNARVGDTLGAIDVREDITPLVDSARMDFFFSLALIAPVPFLMALLVTVYVNKTIDRSIALLEKSVEAVNSVSDLKNLAVSEINFGFVEINKIFNNIGALSDKLRSVAVDRDLLEFEIRLLEKFIITSDVVKDWHEYVGQLLIDISKIINVYALFSVFRVDGELFDVDVFWRLDPSIHNKEKLERAVRRQLSDSDFSGGTSVAHHVVEKGLAMEPFEERDMTVKVKSLLLETPKIGGIVGIGVHLDITKDETRALVVDSILSTLLNVIGSVKAIYKYTKDLEYFATRDPLTRLYNQRVFWELHAYEILRAQRHSNKFSLLMIDFDNFKMVNDTHGHAFGDRFLEEFSACIRSSLRSGDVLARYAGDEFVIILPESDLPEACEAAGRILESTGAMTIEAPDGTPVKGTVSIGISVYPDHAIEAKDLFLFADNMMYKAKADGKGRVGIPTEEDMVEIFRSIGEKSMIVVNAVENETIVPYFQPIVSVRGETIEAVEILSRIAVLDGRVMEAGEFVEIAEKVGVIHKLDYIVLEKAMQQVRALDYQGYLFINISPRALILNEFTSRVKRIISEYGVEPRQIVFEITERDTIRNLTLIDKFVGDLKLSGFRFAIDDFGSGFSSFHYLKRFPVDFVKIEGEFIANMVSDGKDRAFVKSITALAHSLGIQVIGEHVESAKVMEMVVEAGVDFAQGYHIGRPSPKLARPLQVGDRRRPIMS